MSNSLTNCEKHTINAADGIRYAPLTLEGRCILCDMENKDQVKTARSAKIEELARKVMNCPDCLNGNVPKHNHCCHCGETISGERNRLDGFCQDPGCVAFQLRELLKQK